MWCVERFAGSGVFLASEHLSYLGLPINLMGFLPELITGLTGQQMHLASDFIGESLWLILGQISGP